jgi:Tfp pilus assembly protein PilN
MVIILSIAVQLVDIHKKNTILEALQNEIGRLQPQVKMAQQKKQFVEFFDRKLENDRFIPDLIEELSLLTPEEISFRTLSLDKERHVTIQGYAQSHAGINDFQESLIRSKRFHDVDLKFATNRKIANKSVMDFKMALQLSDGEEDAL